LGYSSEFHQEAQEKTSLTLDEAIHLAWAKSNEVSLANTKVDTKKYELQSVKNNRYPDLKVAGQYQRLNASIDLKSIKIIPQPLNQYLSLIN
jgi:outer membrane protein TolC